MGNIFSREQQADYGQRRRREEEVAQREHAVRIHEEIRPNDQIPFGPHELGYIQKQVTKFSGEAQKLREEAERGDTSCIYRVLPWLKQINGNLRYEPNMVSIGPYYYYLRKEKLKMAEDCKMKCFGYLLGMCRNPQEQIDTYKLCLQRIKELEVEIRKCYSEEFEVSCIQFLEMMVLDACFIIEIIQTFGGKERNVDSKESVAAFEWMVPYLCRDFLLLENQIPFFVLDEIFAILLGRTVADSRDSLTYSALEFFQNALKKVDLNLDDYILRTERREETYRALHLLDLVRRSLTPSNSYEILRPEKQFHQGAKFIHCISKLRLAGIKVSPVKTQSQSFLEVKFKKGVIEMPNIVINDFMRCLLLNCVAFEQSHKNSDNYFTVYATFLDCLMNASDDIEYLRERNIIDNYFGDDDSEVAEFFNQAGKDLVLKVEKGFYLWKLFEDVDKHYRNGRNWTLARFEREYIDKPWLLLSAAGGTLLVLATIIQAVMAALAYKEKIA